MIALAFNTMLFVATVIALPICEKITRERYERACAWIEWYAGGIKDGN